MKRLLLAGFAFAILITAYGFSGSPKTGQGNVNVEIQERNPWTHLQTNDTPEQFSFVVVSDRTGGHRARIFSQAVEQINLLQPAFVVSVGDLIEGYSKNPAKVAEEWKEFQGYVNKLQMPFFYVPGNHDLSNPGQSADWKSRFGRAYYHFLYRDVLFLAVNSDDPFLSKEDGSRISPEQIAYFAKVLQENSKARWTFVLMHKPMWMEEKLETSGWLDMEKLLKDRQYTVFVGHEHRFQKFIRQGQNYYQLASTGGASKLRGLSYGEFDQVAWVTVKKDTPIVANLLLDGIYTEDMRKPVTEESGTVVRNRVPVVPVRGRVVLDGAPVSGAHVLLYKQDNMTKKYVNVADGLSDGSGSFALSTYEAFDGVPIGEYIVTVVQRDPKFDPLSKHGPNRLPPSYAAPATSNLRFEITPEKSELDLRLSREKKQAE